MLKKLDEVVYLDHATTTPLAPAAADALIGALAIYGSPSSHHRQGVRAQDALESARDEVSRLLGGSSGEITFTASSPGAAAIALERFFAARGYAGNLVTTELEQAATYASIERLLSRGVHVTTLPVTDSGHIRIEDVRTAVDSETALVSVVHVNSEIGTVQPVEAIIEHAVALGIPVHVDAMQSAGKLPLDHLDAELLSIEAHMLGGPKGIGALRTRRLAIENEAPGDQRLSGPKTDTENVASALSFAAAAAAAVEHETPTERARIATLGDRLRDGLGAIAGARLFGSGERVAEITSVSFGGVRGDSIAELLDVQGICVGATSHGSGASPSRLLRAMGVSEAAALGAVRYSIGPRTTAREVDVAVALTRWAVAQLRMVPAAPAAQRGSR